MKPHVFVETPDEPRQCLRCGEHVNKHDPRPGSTYVGVSFRYELSPDQGTCPMCGGEMALVEDSEGYLCRSCMMCDSFSGLPLVDAVYRMNADQRITGGRVVELPDVDPIEVSGKLVDADHRRRFG